MKATDHLTDDKPFVPCNVSTKDLHYWYWEAQRLPFVLVLYDAKKNRAYWLDVRKYIDDVLSGLDIERKTIEVQIPWKNKVTLRTIDQFRGMSLSRMAREG